MRQLAAFSGASADAVDMGHNPRYKCDFKELAGGLTGGGWLHSQLQVSMRHILILDLERLFLWVVGS